MTNDEPGLIPLMRAIERGTPCPGYRESIAHPIRPSGREHTSAGGVGSRLRLCHSAPRAVPSAWRDLVMPREHGSWSLALEPLVLGLLVAPSLAGSGLALATVAAFFARRPLRIAWTDASPNRRAAARRALAVCAAIALAFFSIAVALAGVSWLWWLAPSALGGAVFLSFDLHRRGRGEIAEIAGATTFAFLPAALATIAGWSPREALALALVMLGRAVPATLNVRACLRAAKSGITRPAPALLATGLALIGGAVLAWRGLAPLAIVVWFGAFALRSGVLLVFPRPALRARTLGLIEAIAGVVFVFGAAMAWR